MYMTAVNHVRAGSKGTIERDSGDATLSLDMSEAVETVAARGTASQARSDETRDRLKGNPAGTIRPAGQTYD
jgi:hypothetical protein